MSAREGQRPKLNIVILKKLVTNRSTSSLPPVGFDPLTASPEELKKLSSQSRPHPVFQPAEYCLVAGVSAPPAHSMAFAFDILPRSKSTAAIFPANCRGGKPAPIGLVPISRRGRHGIFGRYGRISVPTPNLPTAARPARSIAAPPGSASTGSVCTTARTSRRQPHQADTSTPVYSATVGDRRWENDVGQAYPSALTGSCRTIGSSATWRAPRNRKQGLFLIRNVTTNQLPSLQFQGAPPTSSWHRPFEGPGSDGGG